MVAVGSVVTGSDLGLAVHLLPLFGSRTLLLLSSLFVSSPRGIALLAALEHPVYMSWPLCSVYIWDLSSRWFPPQQKQQQQQL